ncbi:MAG: ATP-binding protein [Desulfobacterales bacterium]|jgi:PAS domain S-box-containing protein
MDDKPTYEELEKRVKELESEVDPKSEHIKVSGINIEWDTNQGTCAFENLPVAMMWIDTTLAGLMSGVQAMVGTERFSLALQSEGRNSVEDDWQVISKFSDFGDGFKAIANIAAVAGWGDWNLVSMDQDSKKCRFRVKNSWEGRYQRSLGVCWKSGMLAGKLAGYCSKYFGTNCWARQTAFIAKGDSYDEFIIEPSDRSIEMEIENLLVSDEATRADMAVALQKLREEVEDRKRAEKALGASEEKYRLLFENANDAIFIAQDGFIKFPNPQALKMTRYTEEGLSKIPFVNLIHPQDRDFVLERHKKRLAGEDLPMTYSFRIINKSGEELWVQINAAVITWEDRPATINFLRDITEQMHLEQHLQQSQKMESIGTLAGGIAHDFNNILGIIIGNAELALNNIPRENKAQSNLEEIRTASLRARDVVKQLLSFARKTDLEKKPIIIAPIIKETLKLLRSSVPTSIDIRQNISKDIDTIMADPTQIHQIILNLCTNAVHAMPDGGIIEVALKNMELDEAMAARYADLKPGLYVNLIVNDTGHGIPEEEMDRIFDPYFTTKEVGKGTGMGLAFVHGIVKSHEGWLSVESEPGKGTIFSIFFPAVEKEAVIETETAEEVPTGNERILFVDDMESMVFIGQNRLEKLGYRVETRMNPVEALELFRADPHRFDLVITDMAMPRMTGDRLVKEMLKIRPDLPTILCTGFSEKIDEIKAKEIGICEYIEKPLTMIDLAKAVRKVLDENK